MLCECGCGQVTLHRWLRGHYNRRRAPSPPPAAPGSFIPCACGCGALVKVRLLHGRWTRFVHAHNGRVQPRSPRFAYRHDRGVWRKPESRNHNTGHERARKLKSRDACELAHIGGCLGKIQVHHKDKDPGNNAEDNLMSLCIAHHSLVDAGRINLEAPVMPPFYVDRSGKRRYLDGWLQKKAWGWRRAMMQQAS